MQENIYKSNTHSTQESNPDLRENGETKAPLHRYMYVEIQRKKQQEKKKSEVYIE
jgi:hypothetical protein